jgi:hypothetical protein
MLYNNDALHNKAVGKIGFIVLYVTYMGDNYLNTLCVAVI